MNILVEYKWEISIWEIDNSNINHLRINEIMWVMMSSILWANNKFDSIIETNIKNSNTIWDLFNIK